MTTLDEKNKSLILENIRLRKIVDHIELIHYMSVDEKAAKQRNEALLLENAYLRQKLCDMYDL